MQMSFGGSLGVVLQVVVGGALGVGYVVTREQAMDALLAGDWKTAEEKLRVIAPLVQALEARGIEPL